MDGLRNQLVRRKSGTGSGGNTALRPPTVERCDQLQVTMRGWLYRLEGGAIKQWKRRWFVLGDYCLFYYKDSNEEKCHGSILLPSYRVSLCRSSEDGITRKYSFKLEHQNMKTYFMAADSKESMEQWMTALNLASIMQLNYGSNNSNGNSNVNTINLRDLTSGQPATITGSINYGSEGRNQSDGQDVTDSRMMMTASTTGNVKGFPTRCGNGGDEEEDSGFNSYIPRRPPMPNSLNNSSTDSSGYLPAGAKYPGSYNCINLPPMSYHNSSYLTGHPGNPQLSQSLIYPNQTANHQKRSHYANAPPKPRRQQLDESGVLNCSDLYPVTNEFGAIPPGSVYGTGNTNQYFGLSNGPAPDLIAHNNANVNVTSSPNNGPPIVSNDPNNSISSNNSINIANNLANQNGTNTAVSNSSYYQGSPYNPEYPRSDGVNMQYQLTSPMSPTANVNQHYSIPPPSQFALSNQMTGYHPHHHHQHIQQQIQPQLQQQQQQQPSANQYSRARLPPRPHSADFLDREVQDEDEMAETENRYQSGNNVNNNNNSPSSKLNSSHQYFQQQQQQQQQQQSSSATSASTSHRNNATSSQGQLDTDQKASNANSGGNSNQQQSIQTPKILPIRPKSSLERYDPYYYTNHIEYGTNNGHVNQQQQLTSPPSRPWSDYLQQANRQNLNQQPVTSNGLPPNNRPKGINFPPSNFDVSPRGQQDRDASLLRLLEWKQKMLSGPLNKRNSSTTSAINMNPTTSTGAKSLTTGSVKSPSHHHLYQHSHHLNNSIGSDLTFSDVPMRPPLPKEYRNKMGLNDSHDPGLGRYMGGEMKSREEPIFSRERSKSIGSSFPVNDITYSSDDEGTKSGPNDTVALESAVNRVRRRHESCGNPVSANVNSCMNPDALGPQLMMPDKMDAPLDNRTCSSPDYMNINQLYSIPVKMITSNPTYMGPTIDIVHSNCNIIETNPNPNNMVTMPIIDSAMSQPSMLTLPRSVGDGQESEENREAFINREDYYKAPSTLRQSDLTMSTGLVSSSQAPMMVGLMTTGTPVHQSMVPGVTLESPTSLVPGYQHLSNCQFNYNSLPATVATPLSPSSSLPTSPSTIPMKQQGSMVDNSNNNVLTTGTAVTSGSLDYPDQWNLVGDPYHMSRCLSRAGAVKRTVTPVTNSMHSYRFANYGPNSTVSSSVSIKMPPPPPPKPQPKSSPLSTSTIPVQSIPTTSLASSSKTKAPLLNSTTPVYNDANEPSGQMVDSSAHLSEVATPSEFSNTKHGNIIVDAENNVVVNSSSVNKNNANLNVDPSKNEEAASPPLSSVKERIKLLESKAAKEGEATTAQQHQLQSSSSSSTSSKDGRQIGVNLHNQSKIFREIYNEPEPNDSIGDIGASKAVSSNKSVHNDPRKTAEATRDGKQSESRSRSGVNECVLTSSDRGEADGSSLSSKAQAFSTKVSGEKPLQNEPSASSFSGYEDKGEDADDEMSREFDSSQYKSNDITGKMPNFIPSSAKQKLLPMGTEACVTGSTDPRIVKHMLQNPSDLVPTSSSTRVKCDSKIAYQSVPELVMDSSPSFSTSMDNPAYVSSSYLDFDFAIKDNSSMQPQDDSLINASSEPQVPDPGTNNVTSESLEDIANLPEAPKVAPYYYSDLLPNGGENGQLPINYREREKLSSRLQRSHPHNNNNKNNNSGQHANDDQRVKIDEHGNPVGAFGKKRCITPEAITESDDNPPFIRDNGILRSSLRLNYVRSEGRRSRSLENLDDDHLYENLEFLRSGHSEAKRSVSSNKNDNEKLPELPVKQKNIIMPDNKKNNVTYSQIRKAVKFDDSMDQRDKKIGKEKEQSSTIDESESESERSLVDGEGSQSGSYLDKKLRKRRSPRSKRSQDDLKNVSDSETSKPPPPPPLPLGYNQHGYPYYSVNDNHASKLQRKLSRSVGTGLQNEQDIYNSKIFSSAGELLGKTHEELVLLLIQLRRNQSHLASTCDSLRLQMESEEKMMEIEPLRREEHKSRYKELRESLLEAERQYESQFPVIDMVDNMVKLNHPGPGSGGNRQHHQHNRDHHHHNQHHYHQQQQHADSSPIDNDHNDFDFKRSKAASTSFLDRFPESQGVTAASAPSQPTTSTSHPLPMVPQRSEQLKFTNYLSPPKKKEEEDGAESEDQAKEQEKLIQYLKQDKDILEKTLEGVRSSLTNLSLNGGSDGDDSPSTSSNIDKMKQQQQLLEGELGRVRGLIVQSAKRLEQRAVENAWMEQDVLIARSQLDQILSTASSNGVSAQPDPVSLEAELANIDQAIDNLHAKRKEILENFKKQKTPDPSPNTMPTGHQQQKSGQPTSITNNNHSGNDGKTNTSTSSGYGETDMDSMESRDMTPFNYLKGYQQLSPAEEMESASGSNHLYENLETNLANYGYDTRNGPSKVNGRLDEYIDENQSRSDESASETTTTTTKTLNNTTTRSERVNPESNINCVNYNDNYDYGESSDGQQYTFQQPLLASNKTVRLVKRESERRRVTNKLTTYSTATSSASSSSSSSNTSGLNYNNNNINDNTQYFQHFPQENDLSDFPVYTVNHSAVTATIEGGGSGVDGNGSNDDHFSEVNYDITMNGKRPSTLNLIESTTIKSDERKEVGNQIDDPSPTSLRSSLSDSANDLPALVIASSSSCNRLQLDRDLDNDKFTNSELIRPSTSTSGYLSNVSQPHLSSNSSPICSPSTLSTITDDNDIDKPSNAKLINDVPIVSAQSFTTLFQSTFTSSFQSASETPDLVKSANIKPEESFNDESIFREIGHPQKIEIPKRFAPESENDEEVTMEELTKRTIKAESFRKMLSDAAYGSFTPIHRRNQSSSSLRSSTGLPCSSTISSTLSNITDGCINAGQLQPLRKICSSSDIETLDSTSKKVIAQDVKTLFNQEKKRRAELLALSSEIAKEATEKSRKVANVLHGAHSPSSFI